MGSLKSIQDARNWVGWTLGAQLYLRLKDDFKTGQICDLVATMIWHRLPYGADPNTIDRELLLALIEEAIKEVTDV